MDSGNVSAVVCTRNSIAAVEECLTSLREARVGEIIVVDAHSDDGTREVADRLADIILEDPGTGLGNARNIGIAASSCQLILNMGSDNVMPHGQLEILISTLEAHKLQGVSSQTVIRGAHYPARGLNFWRKGRFRPGPAPVIGTPTLFWGDMLRAYPYDTTRVFSDDSELCERWSRAFGARFAIADAYVWETGKSSWAEVATRCRMYGISDEEVFRIGRASGWSLGRQARSILHPLRVDLVEPVIRLPASEAISALPFLVAFTVLRYATWLKTALKGRVD